MKNSPLCELHRARGARMFDHEGWLMPAEFAGATQEYQSLRCGSGLLDFSPRGKLRIVGADRRSWLHGLVTQDVNRLADGSWAPAAMLSPQGQLLAVMRIFALPGSLLVDCPAASAAFLPEYFDRFLFVEKAEVQDLTEQFALLSLQGPQSTQALTGVVGAEAVQVDHGRTATVNWGSTVLVIARASHCGEDGYDVFVPTPDAPALYAALYSYEPTVPVQSVGYGAFNQRRIEAGRPLWGHELEKNVVPFEARLEDHVSMNKGCYIGQEIVARLDARGQVNNRLMGLALEGESPPEPDAEVHCGDRKVGRVTSAIWSTSLGRMIALAYLRREVGEPGTKLCVAGGDGVVGAEVTDLPFLPDACRLAAAQCVPHQLGRETAGKLSEPPPCPGAERMP